MILRNRKLLKVQILLLLYLSKEDKTKNQKIQPMALIPMKRTPQGIPNTFQMMIPQAIDAISPILELRQERISMIDAIPHRGSIFTQKTSPFKKDSIVV